jgi:hypothetical protein
MFSTVFAVLCILSSFLCYFSHVLLQLDPSSLYFFQQAFVFKSAYRPEPLAFPNLEGIFGCESDRYKPVVGWYQAWFGEPAEDMFLCLSPEVDLI